MRKCSSIQPVPHPALTDTGGFTDSLRSDLLQSRPHHPEPLTVVLIRGDLAVEVVDG